MTNKVRVVRAKITPDPIAPARKRADRTGLNRNISHATLKDLPISSDVPTLGAPAGRPQKDNGTLVVFHAAEYDANTTNRGATEFMGLSRSTHSIHHAAQSVKCSFLKFCTSSRVPARLAVRTKPADYNRPQRVNSEPACASTDRNLLSL